MIIKKVLITTQHMNSISFCIMQKYQTYHMCLLFVLKFCKSHEAHIVAKQCIIIRNIKNLCIIGKNTDCMHFLAEQNI